MAERIELSAEPRSVTGKKVKLLRREGWVPAVIYGRTEPVVVQVERSELRRVLRAAGMTDLIDVSVGSDLRTVLARDIQQHLTRGDILHVDFLEVNLQERIAMEIDLVITGALPVSLSAIGSVALVLQSVHLEALPADLPSEIEVDLSQITSPEHTIHVKDLPVPEGVTFLTDPEMAVTTFGYTRIEEVEVDEAEDLMFAPSADSVEVIARSKEEDEDF